MNVAIIGDKYLANGYRLAGIKAIPIRDIEDAVRKFKETVLKKEYDMILIPEEYADRIKRESKLLESGKNQPIISIIPGLKGLTKGRTAALYDLVSQAIGTKLKVED